MQTIRSAMNAIEQVSCVRFEENPSDSNHVQVHSGKGCYSSVGMQSKLSRNEMSLNKKGCFNGKGTIMHELLHVLGEMKILINVKAL